MAISSICWDKILKKLQLRVASYELLVTRWKLNNRGWNSKVQVQIFKSELRVQIHKFKFTSYELNFTSCEFKPTSYEFKSTSYEFKFTSYKLKSMNYHFKFTIYEFKSTRSRIIKSMKTQVNSLTYKLVSGLTSMAYQCTKNEVFH